MTMCEEILDIKTTMQPAMICSDSVYSTPAIDLKKLQGFMQRQSLAPFERCVTHSGLYKR